MFKFACASIEGLTLSQKRETLKALRASISAEVADRRASKMFAKDAKLAEREAKKALRIAKLQAKLDALTNPVGAKAIKANRKPGKVTTYGAEDNAIAAAIMAKKQSA
jgi:hypothetical protein